MANKDTTNPKALVPKGYEIDDELSEMKKIKASVASSVQFRNGILESQKRVNYQNEFDRVQAAKRISALHPNVKERMNYIQQKARASPHTQNHVMYKPKL